MLITCRTKYRLCFNKLKALLSGVTSQVEFICRSGIRSGKSVEFPMGTFANWCFGIWGKLTQLPVNPLPVLSLEEEKKYLPLQTLTLEIQEKHVGNAQKYQHTPSTPFPQTSAFTLMWMISKHFKVFCADYWHGDYVKDRKLWKRCHKLPDTLFAASPARAVTLLKQQTVGPKEIT